MSSASLDELTTPLTVAEAKKAIYDVLALVGVTTTQWQPGAVVRTMIAAFAIVLAAFSRLTAAIARAGFLDLSEGAWLTLVAKYVYGVDREEATFAAGVVTLDNASGNTYDYDPDDLIFLNPTTKKTYRNTGTVHVGPLATGVSVAIAAVEAGSGSSAPAGSIVQMETPLTGVTCTNALALVGTDDETNTALRARCRAKTGAASPNGPADAYSYFAKTARRSDGSLIGVTRVRAVADGLGGIDLYCATATGGISGDAADPLTDLGAVNLAIQKQAAPFAITVRVQSAAALAIAVAYEAWAYDTISLTDEQLSDAVSLKLATFMSTEPIGGNIIVSPPGLIYVDKIRSLIDATREEIFHVVVSAPLGDLALGSYVVPVLGAVTGTINKVPKKAI